MVIGGIVAGGTGSRMGSDRPVYLVEGSRENFKITYPLDLQLAQVLVGETELF